jgi:hypothetical protein
MTNLTFTLLLSLSTNWTGTTFQDRELGYVVTNHVAEVVYRGQTNRYTLLSEVSDKAVWGFVVPKPPPQAWHWYEPGTNIVVTNDTFTLPFSIQTLEITP